MALGGSLVSTFAALPTLGSPCTSLPLSSKAGQTPFPVALQTGKAMFKARPGSYLSLPSLSEAQSLSSGGLSVSATVRWTGAPSLQERKHRCPEATACLKEGSEGHRPPDGGPARAASQAGPASCSLPQAHPATPTLPAGSEDWGSKEPSTAQEKLSWCQMRWLPRRQWI